MNGEGPSTPTRSRSQPGMAGNRTQGPRPGFARDHPPPAAANSSQEWWRNAPRALSHEWRRATHNTHFGHTLHPRKHKHRVHHTRDHNHANVHAAPHKHAQSTTTHPTPAKTPATTSKKPQPGMVGRGTQGPQPGLTRDRQTTPAADPSQQLNLNKPAPGPNREQRNRQHPDKPQPGAPANHTHRHSHQTTHRHNHQSPSREGRRTTPHETTSGFRTTPQGTHHNRNPKKTGHAVPHRPMPQDPSPTETGNPH